MGRPSATPKMVAGGTSPKRDRFQKSSGQNVVPWKEMERRVAERIAAKAARGSGRSDIPPWKATQSQPLDVHDIEPAPDSGVRPSEPELVPARPLSFTVYSVEELDARQRMSAPPPSVPPPPPSRWPDVWRSTKALLGAWRSWYKTPKPRSRVMDVCGVPLMTLRVDLWAALKQLPWRKIIVRSAIAVGSLLFLLFIVLTAAELTDDLKPGAARAKETAASASKLEALKPATDVAPAAPVAPEAPAIEIDDAPPAPPPPVVKKPAPKKSVAKKKKKAPDIFNP